MTIEDRGLFVTGTDTGIGKTFVASLLLRQAAEAGVTATGLKPIASGCARTGQGLRNEDAIMLMEASGTHLEYDRVNRYAFEPAIAPHIAARIDGVLIDQRLIKQDLEFALDQAGFVVVEGAGGWRVPLSDQADFADLATTLSLPVLLVVGMRLGCINHAILSAESITRSGLVLKGWVANFFDPDQAQDDGSIAAIEERLAAPLLGKIPYVERDLSSASGIPDLVAALG